MFYCLHKPVHAITGSHNHECFMCCLLGHPFCPNTKATPKVQGIRVFHANANPGSSFLNPYQHQHTHTPAIRITRKRKQKKRKGMQDRRLRCTAGKKIGCSSPLMTLGTLRDWGKYWSFPSNTCETLTITALPFVFLGIHVNVLQAKCVHPVVPPSSPLSSTTLAVFQKVPRFLGRTFKQTEIGIKHTRALQDDMDVTAARIFINFNRKRLF